MTKGGDAKGVSASEDNPAEVISQYPAQCLAAFLEGVQKLSKLYGVAIHGVSMKVHDHRALGFSLSCQGEKRYFHWIAPELTQEHDPTKRVTGYDDVMQHINIAHTSRSDKACRALTAAGFRFLVDFGVDNAINIANEHLKGWEEAYAHLWGKSNLDSPEAASDDICPECGANWAAGDDCDEDCPLDEAYQSEMTDEDEDDEDED